MTNSRSIQRLEDDGHKRYPGITIYDVGDEAHAVEVSGHNHDDKPGVKAEDLDSDNKPEVRALDFMIGKAFTKADAAALFEALTRRPANQDRLLYAIYNRRIRSRTDGWKDRAYTGSNPHTDHVHGSGRAEDDENTGPWDIAAVSGGTTLTQEIDGLRAILSGSGSGTLNAANQLHVKLNKIQTTLDEILKNTEAAALRADGLLNMADVTTSWSDKTPAGKQINKLAAKLNGLTNPDVDEDALATALAAKLQDMLPEGVGLTKDDVRDALADVFNRGADAVTSTDQ
jgi:hypothetical protein